MLRYGASLRNQDYLSTMLSTTLHLRVFALAFCLTTLTGCAGFGTSRWAMDDPVYAEKYDKPYPSNDAKKVARMMKQASDARYVSDRSGWYLGAAGADEPSAIGAEIGAFHYIGHSAEARGALKVLGTSSANGWFGGLDVGIRTQSPSRLAPFVGMGAFVGTSEYEVDATNDGLDNDNDILVDESGETEDEHDFLASFYPEVGAHFWLNSRTRLTANAQYHITTEGRDADFWFVGLSIGFLLGNDGACEE